VAFLKRTYRVYGMVVSILPCALYTSPVSVQGLQGRSCPSSLPHVTLQRQLSRLAVVSLTASKLEPLKSTVFDLAVSYAANMFIHIILYDFSLLSAQFCYIIVYMYICSVVVKALFCKPEGHGFDTR
jgi:hypothetical protein